MNEIKHIPKSEVGQEYRPPFDLPLAEVEATNAVRLLNFHLSRCDDPEAAEKFSEMFGELAEKFKQKANLLKGEFK